MSESFQHGSRDERDSGKSGERPGGGDAGRDGDRVDPPGGRRSDADRRGSPRNDRGRLNRGSDRGGEGYRGRRDDRGGSYSGRGQRQVDRRDDRRGGYGQDRPGEDRAPRRDGEGHRGRRDDRGGSYSGRGQRQVDRREDRGGGYGRDRPGGDRGPRRGGYGQDRPREDRAPRRDGEGHRGRRDDTFRGVREGGFDASTHRHRAPEIDEDITGRELDKPTRAQLGALEPRNAEAVGKHLVMAGRYLLDDPQLALEHARAAGRRGGRIAAVREATGIAAYEAGDYALALKELRTFRRMTGSEVHLPLMVDCERALGRVDKAMELAASPAAESLEAGEKVELAIVLAGMRRDQGDAQGVVEALSIPQLDKNRGFPYSPRLFRAYAEALRGVGRDREALTWDRQAVVAEAALGTGQFAEPEILDFGEDDETERRPADGVDLAVRPAEPADEPEGPFAIATRARNRPDGRADEDEEPDDALDDGLDEPGEDVDPDDDPDNGPEPDLDPDDDFEGGSEPDLDPDDDADLPESGDGSADGGAQRG